MTKYVIVIKYNGQIYYHHSDMNPNLSIIPVCFANDSTWARDECYAGCCETKNIARVIRKRILDKSNRYVVKHPEKINIKDDWLEVQKIEI